MKDMTLSQEYLICAVNEKGKIGSMNIEKVVCLLAAGLLELQLAECITMDQKAATVTAPFALRLHRQRKGRQHQDG